MLLEMKLPPKWILFVAVATVCVITTYVGVMRKPASDIQHQAETIPATFHKIAPSVLSVPCLQKTQHSPPEGGATCLARLEDLPDVQVKSVSCKKLFGGDSDEQTRAKKYHSDHPKVMVTAAQYIKMTASCTAFTQQRKYLMNAVSPEERNFSLAYSILMFKDVEQTERLLRAIYQPQNYYCIHVDAVSPKEIHEAMTAIAGCFSNVFISSRSIHVQWATYSVLEPELVCMRDLWCYPHWRYFINLTGQEWPLKTNGDLVKILTAYNGGNDVEGSVKRSDPERYKFSYSDLTSGEPKAPLKLDVTLTKGSVHIAVQRGFVDFVLHNPISAKFQEWVCDTWIPDETFFSSLNHSPQLKVPGAYLGNPETHPLMKPFLARFKNWGTWPFNFPCEGRWVKQICVLGVGDLPLLYKRKEMFANKFYLDFEPLALDCMEELHWKKVRGEISGTHQFDTSYYAHLSFAKYHLK